MSKPPGLALQIPGYRDIHDSPTPGTLPIQLELNRVPCLSPTAGRGKGAKALSSKLSTIQT